MLESSYPQTCRGHLISRPSAPKLESLLRLYQSLIRPHLEYACSVWDPHLKRDIERLEGVQEFGLKVCLKWWECGYEELLHLTNLPSLATRRKYLKLCLFYNMVNGLATFPNLPTISRSTPYGNSIMCSVTC